MPRTTLSLVAVAALALCAFLVVRAQATSGARGGDPSLERAEGAPQPGAVLLGSPSAAGRDVPAEGCEWFSRWGEQERTPEAVKELVAAMRPLTVARARCIRLPWITAVLDQNCFSPGLLEAEEAMTLLATIGPSDGVAWLKRVAAASEPSVSTPCLVELLIQRVSPDSAAEWAEVLSMVGALLPGGLGRAHPALVALAKRLLQAHPTDDEKWWRGFMGKLSPTELPPVHVRQALYEAVLSALPKLEQWRALEALASFEDQSVTNASLGMVALGLTMRNRFGREEALRALGTSRDFGWRRAVLWSLDPAALWPYVKDPHDEVSRAGVLQSLRLPPEGEAGKFFRIDLIAQLWPLLGAESAASEFAQFAASPSRDGFELAHWTGTVAYEIGRHSDLSNSRDQAAFAAAEETLRELLVRRSAELDEIIEAVLSSKRADDKNARDVLIRAIGPQLPKLRKDLYDRLVR